MGSSKLKLCRGCGTPNMPSIDVIPDNIGLAIGVHVLWTSSTDDR